MREKKSRTGSQQAESIRRVLSGLIRDRRMEDQFELHQVFLFWEKAVGRDIAAHAKPEVIHGTELWLDLGDVKNIAEVSVNGTSLGIVWKRPFRVNVTRALKPGANALSVKVTNLWVNRLIGDQQEGVTKKYTYTAQQFYRADSPLLPSGLLGPARVLRISAK